MSYNNFKVKAKILYILMLQIGDKVRICFSIWNEHPISGGIQMRSRPFPVEEILETRFL